MNDKFDAWLLKKVWWICVMDHLFHMFKYFCSKGSKFKFTTFWCGLHLSLSCR
jgi:hypothetical protein